MDEDMKCSDDSPKGKEPTFFSKLGDKHSECHVLAGELSTLCELIRNKVVNPEPTDCEKDSNCDAQSQCATEDALDTSRMLRNRLNGIRAVLEEINGKL